jgi:hypothetical protein
MLFLPSPLIFESTASGGTGVDPSTFWLILVAMGGTISTLAGMLYKGERDRRVDAERKLAAFQEIAPDLAENVQWLVEEANAKRDQQEREKSLPYSMIRTTGTRTPTHRPTTRRRPP